MFCSRSDAKPSSAPETETETDVSGGGADDNTDALTVEILGRFMKGVEAMHHAMTGDDEVSICGDRVRVTFDIPLGEDPDAFFEKAKQAYLKKLTELRKKLGG